MTDNTFLLIGFGNPGREYKDTRHNIGFMFIDRVAVRLNARGMKLQAKAIVMSTLHEERKIILAKPQTYMNLSGEAVSGLLAKPDRSVEKMIVISDDLALPYGSIRIRPKGSHGGQNGLRSIIDCLKTQEFARLRIGIQPEHDIRDAARFVLDNFTKKEAETLENILETSADAVRTIITDGVDAAMGKFN